MACSWQFALCHKSSGGESTSGQLTLPMEWKVDDLEEAGLLTELLQCTDSVATHLGGLPLAVLYELLLQPVDLPPSACTIGQPFAHPWHQCHFHVCIFGNKSYITFQHVCIFQKQLIHQLNHISTHPHRILHHVHQNYNIFTHHCLLEEMVEWYCKKAL